MHSRCSKISAIVLCAFAAANASAASPTYRIELLPAANGIVPRSAGAISDNGNVAGYGRLSGTSSKGAFLAKGGRNPQLLAGSKNGDSDDFDVNDAGEVMGSHLRHDNGYPERHGALWTSDGQLHDLAELAGCDMSLPEAFSGLGSLNEAGDMVFKLSCTVGGTVVDTSVLWRDGVMTVLPTLGGDLNYALDINSHGEITGGAQNSSGYMTAYTLKDGVIKSLGTLGGGLTSSGSVINDQGHVAGVSSLPDWQTRAFLHDGTTMRELPLCKGQSVSPVALTNDDVVIGYFGSSNNRRTAVIEDGQCKVLTDLLDSSGASWSGLRARGANNHGVIVGEGMYKDKRRAFIATPLSR